MTKIDEIMADLEKLLEAPATKRGTAVQARIDLYIEEAWNAHAGEPDAAEGVRSDLNQVQDESMSRSSATQSPTREFWLAVTDAVRGSRYPQSQ